MTSSVLRPVLMSLIAGASTSLGASCIYFLKPGPVDPQTMSFSLALAAGVMLSVSALELMPRVFFSKLDASTILGIVCALAGAASYLAISYCIPHVHGGTYPTNERPECDASDEEMGMHREGSRPEYRTVPQDKKDDETQCRDYEHTAPAKEHRLRAWRFPNLWHS